MGDDPSSALQPLQTLYPVGGRDDAEGGGIEPLQIELLPQQLARKGPQHRAHRLGPPVQARDAAQARAHGGQRVGGAGLAHAADGATGAAELAARPARDLLRQQEKYARLGGGGGPTVLPEALSAMPVAIPLGLGMAATYSTNTSSRAATEGRAGSIFCSPYRAMATLSA
eukprot:CAMPEP_0173199584 /NCGR_PEP_ID=MMETSP1141-20130122/17316_1 /TAXON_ID=483371 /ORGANISM="non described non described, Strain CCMP2298" /LENGTH=169 /DNA_ID=CAMNT_0014124489 /DNA_START=472 /DNA_END=980 /DNA_ORIENTATION=-